MPLSSSMKVRPKTQMGVKGRTRFSDKATYTPPEEDVQTWSFSKMIECWELRDKQCFWENFMWLIDNKQDTERLILNFDTPWQADLQSDPGSDTRCITSDQPKVKWWSTLGDTGIPNLFNREEKEVRCQEIQSAGYQLKMEQSCRAKCNRLAQGEECRNRNVAQMGFEQVGCDGKTVYCWCNSSNSYKK